MKALVEMACLSGIQNEIQAVYTMRRNLPKAFNVLKF